STKEVCTGEILQTKNCYRFDLARAEYLRILKMKTGVLFALACDLGGLLASGTPMQRASLREYGLALGTAYQIYDDCLDLYATEKATGKSLGTDLANGKLTLPLIVLLERASETDRERFRSLFQSFERNALPEVLTLLEKYSALAESQRVVNNHCEEARRLLVSLPANDSREALKKLTVFLAQQTRSLGVVH
ncbi:MAG TPA: polyprenyl synthetase family protein, partial [Candidatus Paceibacterota bacterium]|nr:polyprenyl synthetase family protein [Candidatus Paceibacterota bacterium]